MNYNIKELKKLPEQEKIEIITELIDSMTQHTDSPLPRWKSELYKERLAYYKQNSNEGIGWNDLKMKYLSK
ncbi:MAG: addiction module protein [Niabella sp.]